MTRSLTHARLAAQPSPTMVEHVYAVELADELADAHVFVLVDLAHAVGLTRTGVFTPDAGRSIVSALLDLHYGDTVELLSGDPWIGTITLQIEHYLERACGPVGLDIQRARSRIDQNATGLRLADRTWLLPLMTEMLELGQALLDAAATNDGVVIPGYTHLQHAQPTTLGHYFNAHYWSLSRNLTRLLEAYARLNVCPLGGAAHSGTSWPLDRGLVASYLGFDAPIANARDAGMSAVDLGAELASSLALTLSGISRCASDLYFWSSSEVGLVRLHPSLCSTSSMMPQKRNPIVLERIRGLAGDATGWAASQLGLLHTATSTDADLAYVHNPIPEYCRATTGAVRLMKEAVRSLQVDHARMARSAASHWATSSALADALVRSKGLSYREAHEEVARLVAEHEMTAGPDPVQPLNPGPARLTGLTDDETASALDVHTFIETRTSQGGTAKGRRLELAEAAAEDLAQHADAVHAKQASAQRAQDELLADAHVLSGTAPGHS